MSWQIIKNLRKEGDDLVCEMRSNNVYPCSYYEWRKTDTPEMRENIRQWIKDRVWQPIHLTKFIQQL